MADTFQDFDTMQEFLSSKYYKQALEQFKASKEAREWEIVAYSFKPLSGKISREPIIGPNSKYWQQAQQDSEDYAIHSVRRLSDDWTVSVNDKVKTCGCKTGIIKSFDLTGHILFEDICGVEHITMIEKLPQPILTTVDGVEIFEGMEFWGIRDWRVLEGGKADKYDKNLDKAAPVFSTREAAEDYILNHKPVLSLNDVREALPEQYWLSKATVIDRLTALVKEKINQ